MTTPIVIETVRNGSRVGKLTPTGQGTSATPPSDRSRDRGGDSVTAISKRTEAS
jgi:hypothetical protein